jgi:hypothetical protein
MVYVLNKNGKPLMPCSEAKAKHLLQANRAKVKRTCPFTIQLLWDCEENVQEVIAGMDSGSKTIGSAAVGNGKVKYQAETQLRENVSKKMEQRKMFRRTRRNRKTRYRKARWLNRASMRKDGRLAPSIKSKVDAHLREKKFVESILPVSKWVLELASFDIHKISNPEVTRWEYQKGQQMGFYNLKAYVLHRDGYQCQKCKVKNSKLHVHHLEFISNGGTDTPNNLITLCEDCHSHLHAGKFTIKGLKSKTKHATEMGVIKSQLKKSFGDFEETFGYETKFKREQIMQLPKTHYNDAIAICCLDGELVDYNKFIVYRKHISKGDYQQRKGSHSEKKIPTGKLFGFRKFDKVKIPLGVGFIKGKRSSGAFEVCDIFGLRFEKTVNAKKDMQRISARKSILMEVATIPSCPQEDGVFLSQVL